MPQETRHDVRERVSTRRRLEIHGDDRRDLGLRFSDSEKADICGVECDTITLDDALRRIQRLITVKRRALVINAGVNHIVQASKDERYAAVLRGADLVLPTARRVRLAAWLLGAHVADSFSVRTLLDRVCREAVRRGWRMYLVGGPPAGAIGVADVLCELYPGLPIVGASCAIHHFSESRRVSQPTIDTIRALAPDLVVVGESLPEQERWIVEHAEEFGPTVTIGLGRDFRFVSNRARCRGGWWRHLFRRRQSGRRGSAARACVCCACTEAASSGDRGELNSQRIQTAGDILPD
jgi:N-acetylglucosaminyldiphosphoundecaprenol N-acetyl-beta-D-mannosaminyltransferase